MANGNESYSLRDAGFSALLAAPAGGGSGGDGGSRRSRATRLPSVAVAAERRPQTTEGVTEVEKGLLTSSEADEGARTYPDGELRDVEDVMAVTSGAAVVPVQTALVSGDVAAALHLEIPQHVLRASICDFLSANTRDPNARLPLGTSFPDKFTNWNLFTKLITGNTKPETRGFFAEIARGLQFASACKFLDDVIEDSARELVKQPNPKPAPLWFLYDVLLKIAQAAGDEQLIASLKEEWDAVQLIHAHQIGRAHAKAIAVLVETRFKDLDEIRITDIGARTGDALGVIASALERQFPDKQFIFEAYDLEPRPHLGTHFQSDRRFSGLDMGEVIQVQPADVTNLDASGAVSNSPHVIIFSNTAHKLRKEQQGLALSQIASRQAKGGILFLQSPDFDRMRKHEGVGRTLQAIDTSTVGQILSRDDIKAMAKAAGYASYDSHDMDTTTGALDNFRHILHELEK